ncbi:hypothetical protein SERLADRAFT_456355 [Serpula lacrymans var. lacrymans S7.9]|uniref:Uncharacterized protein n=1 Tax=Serpula lacrymans var. lacrymans (strain S7.9) TaxID=578457 RepID=F8NIZ9_SERL9|nr:uncharacterized protein SERLADRAFT_456355 [Serpula lacrymans var. lacrymans S7.9]EGO29032.1 hypothetical protein SERLADRAFT_456355 [Serpula lacrymans var. lacrymans S7.9]
MRFAPLAALLVLPLLSTAQSSNSPNVQLSTSVIASVGLGSGRVVTTVLQTTVFTVAAASPTVTSSGNNTSSGNSTNPTNSTTSGNSTSSVTPSNLPTAASSVPGVNGGPNGAPSPGASAPGGIYGPPDGYIAAANALKRNAVVVSLLGVTIGTALVFI